MRAAWKKRFFPMKWIGLKPVALAERNSISANARWKGKPAVLHRNAGRIVYPFFCHAQGQGLRYSPSSPRPFPLNSRPEMSAFFPVGPLKKPTVASPFLTLSDPKRQCYDRARDVDDRLWKRHISSSSTPDRQHLIINIRIG